MALAWEIDDLGSALCSAKFNMKTPQNRAYPAGYTECQNNCFNTNLFLQIFERLFVCSKQGNKLQNLKKMIFYLPISSNYVTFLKTGSFSEATVVAKDMETNFPR